MWGKILRYIEYMSYIRASSTMRSLGHDDLADNMKREAAKMRENTDK